MTKVLSGMVGHDIHHLRKPDRVTAITMLCNNQTWLVVFQTVKVNRALPISKEVAEVLIARGMPFGN